MEEAIGYARISIKDQSHHSIPGQVNDITAYCQRNQLKLHKIFIDKGQSAFNFNRREWKEVESYLKDNRNIQYLVVLDLDRFSRADLVDALQKMNEIQKRNQVKILTVTDPVGLDIEDFGTELRRVMQLLFSNYELRKIRKRTSDGMYTAMSSGRWVSRAPFGYANMRDADGKPVLMIDEEKAFVVRLVFRQYLGGMELEEIRRHAAANGLKLKGNSAIRRMLSNPLYAALLQLPKKGNKAPEVIRAIHAPIISEANYWIVQDRLHKKTRATRRNDELFLKGTLACEQCGRYLSTDKVRNRHGNYYQYYLCKEHRKNISVIKLHKQFDEIFDLLSLPEETIEETRQAALSLINQRLAGKGGDLMRVKLNLQKVQDKITATQERFLKQPDIAEKVYHKVITELKADEQRLQRQVSELSNSSDEYYALFNELLPRLSNTRELFHTLPVEKKKAFLHLVFAQKVTYRDDIVRTPHLHFLFSHNVLLLKEKKLLIVEQLSEKNNETPICSPYGNWLEHLTELWRVVA